MLPTSSYFFRIAALNNVLSNDPGSAGNAHLMLSQGACRRTGNGEEMIREEDP